MTSHLFVTVIFILNLICVFSLIFIERREPTTTWAWLLILLILPGVGFAIYLLFGQNLSRQKLFREKKIIDMIRSKESREKHEISIREKYELKSSDRRFRKNYEKLINMNYNQSGAIYTTGNSVKIYTNGEDKFRDLFNDIRDAKRFVHIEYYIFRFDDLGMALIHELKNKVKEGVEVRFLVDGMGSKNLKKAQIKYIESLGIKFGVFFPGILPHINTRINYRNHRKIVIIDGEIGYTGGFNVGNEYINRGEQFKVWRDTHIKVQGPAVYELNKRFIMDWDYVSEENFHDLMDYFPEVKDKGDVGMQIVSSGPDHMDEYIKNGYMKIINDAKKYVYIQTPYLVPDAPVAEALKIAALSGVDVRVMVPGAPDHFFMEWMLSANMGILLDYGIKIYRYQKGFIHSKTFVSDGKVCSIGTANLDIRSFKLNFEVNAFIYDEEVSALQEQAFINDQLDCILVDKETYEKRTKYLKIKESLIRLVSPIL